MLLETDQLENLVAEQRRSLSQRGLDYFKSKVHLSYHQRCTLDGQDLRAVVAHGLWGTGIRSDLLTVKRGLPIDETWTLRERVDCWRTAVPGPVGLVSSLMIWLELLGAKELEAWFIPASHKDLSFRTLSELNRKISWRNTSELLCLAYKKRLTLDKLLEAKRTERESRARKEGDDMELTHVEEIEMHILEALLIEWAAVNALASEAKYLENVGRRLYRAQQGELPASQLPEALRVMKAVSEQYAELGQVYHDSSIAENVALAEGEAREYVREMQESPLYLLAEFFDVEAK
ncbi:hypothetical protein SLS60_000795 [Paraconiothyrium brasiliense]|uniref:Uncharacterized protein n=1 Tax=Paraconiothyrium brasiliense TaxID=300254 RepID=A0ABR3S8P7_9PLEO